MGVLYLQNSRVYLLFYLLVLIYCQLLNIIAFALVVFPVAILGCTVQ